MTALFVASLLFWSVLTPLDEAPDEVGHADLIFHLASGAPFPAWDERRLSRATLSTTLTHRPNVRASFRTPYLTPEAAQPRVERPDFDEAGGDGTTSFPNQIPQHPPLFYALGAGVLRVERAVRPGADLAPLEQEWGLLRWLGVLLVAPLPLLAWTASRRLGVAPGPATAAAVVPLAIPQLTHIGSAINNDNLLTLLCAVLAVLLAGVVRGDLRRRTAVAAGIVTALALMTKAFAFLLVPWILLAYAVAVLHDRSRLRSGAASAAIAGATAGVLGGWWWAAHYWQEGSLSPSIADRLFTEGGRPTGFGPDLAYYVPRFAGRMVERFWGTFGYLSVGISGTAVLVATLLGAVALLAAFWPRRRAQAGPTRTELAAFGSLAALLVVGVFVHAYRLYAASGHTPFIQGRYLYSALVPFAVILAVGATRVLGRWTALTILAGAVAMQADALLAVRKAWWAEPGASLGRSFRALLAWSPWPPAVVWAFLAGMLTAAALAVWLLIASAREGSSTPGAVPIPSTPATPT